ncbi:MAG: hypothetical protein BWK73_26795 [Thiothrix lacustris]|uniref:Arc-like DNA binding domain-containing protein n=1 Tax=Thiothrix lacustris TaxID=525917 RepID=A0A1Y1QKG7_9GAMM|nr:MAG: hypothetical protein BWK73_26795 [Thiothrix lacustris]
MSLRRLSIHLEPEVDDWIRQLATASGRSINQEINDLLLQWKRKKQQQQQRAAFEATKAKLAAIRNKKAAPEGAAYQPKPRTVE